MMQFCPHGYLVRERVITLPDSPHWIVTATTRCELCSGAATNLFNIDARPAPADIEPGVLPDETEDSNKP